MARLFNGTDQYMKAASVDLSGTPTIAFAYWLYWDANANNDDFELEFSANKNLVTTGFMVDPNWNQGAVLVSLVGDVGTSEFSFPRPSAAAWHHYVINLDKSKASGEIDSVYVDGVSQTLTVAGGDVNNTNNFASDTLNFMSRNGASLFGAGRMAEFGLWYGINLTAAEAAVLGDGFTPPFVRPASLKYYWPLIGRTSPEVELKRGVTATVTGATNTAHPRVLVPGGRPQGRQRFCAASRKVGDGLVHGRIVHGGLVA